MVAFAKGFVAGNGAGYVTVFDRADDVISSAAAQQAAGAESHANQSGLQKELYKKSKDYLLQDENSKVANMAISPNEDNLVCSLDNNQVYCIALSSADVKVYISYCSTKKVFLKHFLINNTREMMQNSNLYLSLSIMVN